MTVHVAPGSDLTSPSPGAVATTMAITVAYSPPTVPTVAPAA